MRKSAGDVIEISKGRRHGRCSPMQERWYRLRQSHPDARSRPPFQVTEDWTLNGAIDDRLLQASWTAIVDRHWTLRSMFAWDGDRLSQSVGDVSDSHQLELHDLTAFASDSPQVRQLVREIYQTPLDLEHGRGFRAALIRWRDGTRLILTVDQLVCDCYSTQILRRDLLAVYAAVSADPQRDPRSVLGALTYQYLDWAEHQWQLLAGDYGTALRAFWTQRLAGAPEMIVREDHHSVGAMGRGWKAEASLDPELIAQVDEGSAQADSTATRSRAEIFSRVASKPIALLSVLFAQLYRTTAQTDLSVVVTLPGRIPKFSRVVGLFVVPVMIRIQLHDALTFSEISQRVADAFLEADDWRKVPLYAAIDPPASLSRVRFSYERGGGSSDTAGLALTPSVDRWVGESYMDADLEFLFFESAVPGSLVLKLFGRADKFKRETLEDLAGDLVELAAGFLGSPERTLTKT
ncbi:MAG: hypothetical protein H0T42_15445, partial [Deltaproteobacteria bacterium]|nr:hypothetical protein [Deltaproteobacteria bacterium]